jgi:hypothetical protein
LTVRSGGKYKVIARFEDTTRGNVAYGEKRTAVSVPNTTVSADITLLDPPACLRHVVVEGTVRVDDVYLTGADHRDVRFRLPLFVQYGVASFDDQVGKWIIDPNDPAAVGRRRDVARVGAAVGDTNGQLRIDVSTNADLSVDVTVTGTLEHLSESHSVHVAQDTTEAIPEFSLDTGGPFNDRAYFRGLTISNRAASAI